MQGGIANDYLTVTTAFYSRNRLESCRRICYSDNRKGKVRNTRPTLDNDKLHALQHQPSLLRVVAAIFFP